MSFQRKPPKTQKGEDGESKDDAPRQYSSFKRKAPKAGGFGQSKIHQQRPETGHDDKPQSSFGAPKKAIGKNGRDVDARKSMKVLRALENARAEAIANGADLSVWETEFMGSLETRIDTYGSAFRDPTKGALDEPLSNMQRVKLKEIHAKATGKEKKPGFGKKKKAPRRSSTSAAPPSAVDEEQ